MRNYPTFKFKAHSASLTKSAVVWFASHPTRKAGSVLGLPAERQAAMLVSLAKIPRSPGHVFYDKLQGVLIAAGFDAFVETQCASAASRPPVVAARPLFPHAADRSF